MTEQNYLAFDFGAQSARAIQGKLEAGRLEIEEVYRFQTGGIRLQDSLRWDILQFFEEVKNACKKFSTNSDEDLLGVGVDSWGVDFALLDAKGKLVSNPYHYRDQRTNNIFEDAFKIVSRERIYEITGIQFMQINTLFQLFSMIRSKDPDLGAAHTFLHIADLFHYLLTKKGACEYTLATTSQLYDLEQHDWSIELITKYGLNPTIFPKIIPPATELGAILPNIAKKVGLKGVKVIAPACHDTAAAIAAVPATHNNFIYISSGTWSLLGVELSKPLVSEESLNNNFTNEGGVFNTIRFLKNISGLWILSECKKLWDAVKPTTYKQLNDEASQELPFKFFIDPDHPIFLSPENMIEVIKQFCKKTNQKIPKTRGEITRCILESLAMKYRYVCEMLKRMLSKSFNTLHIIGGGSQNRLLSQFTANSTAMEVKTGPVEATAIGNLLLQAVSQNQKMDFPMLRKIVRSSFDIQTLIPQDPSAWDNAYTTYLEIIE